MKKLLLLCLLFVGGNAFGISMYPPRVAITLQEGNKFYDLARATKIVESSETSNQSYSFTNKREYYFEGLKNPIEIKMPSAYFLFIMDEYFSAYLENKGDSVFYIWEFLNNISPDGFYALRMYVEDGLGISNDPEKSGQVGIGRTGSITPGLPPIDWNQVQKDILKDLRFKPKVE